MAQQATLTQNALLEVVTQELWTITNELAATKKELLATQAKLHLSHADQNQATCKKSLAASVD